MCGPSLRRRCVVCAADMWGHEIILNVSMVNHMSHGPRVNHTSTRCFHADGPHELFFLLRAIDGSKHLVSY